jgi:hypothetical protein
MDYKQVKKYLQHLPDCNISRDWSEVLNIFLNVQEKDRTPEWHSGLNNLSRQISTCTCGLDEVIKSLMPKNEGDKEPLGTGKSSKIVQKPDFEDDNLPF